MKFIFKWLLRLLFGAVVLVVIILLSYNSILRLVIEHNIRVQTGMEAEIGRFHLALTEPTIEIQNLKIYNTKKFDGTPFLDIPEIHVEYDRDALLKRQIHVTLMRFNLGELDIVKNQTGQTNIFLPGIKLPIKGINEQISTSAKQPDFDIKSIDVLNVSIGTAKYIDLKDPRNNREQTIGIDNCVIKNVKSRTDLAGLEALIYLRSGDFFSSLLLDKKQVGVDILLNQLGH
jgi:hypothetical protein